MARGKGKKVRREEVRNARNEELNKQEQEEEEKVASESAEETDQDSSNDEVNSNSEEEESSDGFEDQGSSSEEEEEDDEEENEDEDKVNLRDLEKKRQTVNREKELQAMTENGSLAKASKLHMDDLSSDDEEVHNTIGNVPLRWYDDYDHVGYTVDGKKIQKSEHGDGIDAAISAKDDPNYSRTIYDAYNDRKVVLSDRDIEIIRRIQAGAYAHPEFEANADYVDYYTSEKMIHSLGNDVEPKSRFLPSKWEHMKVMKILKGVKEGRIHLDKKEEKKPEVYELWGDDDQALDRKGPAHVQAPKMPLPGHAESYNPPEEYLFTEKEKKEWEEMDPEDREYNFIPRKFNSLREVAGYKGFVRERFERCLDLYLCPRVNKRRLNIDPESLVPELPKPRDLRPFPNNLAICFNGHTARVRTVSMGPYGQYFASGSDDSTVRLWEVETGRCVRTWNVGAVVQKIVWNPNKDHHVLAVAAANKVILIATGTGSGDQTEITNALLGDESESTVDSEITEDGTEVIEQTEEDIDEKDKKNKIPVTWKFFAGCSISTSANKNAAWMSKKQGSGVRVILYHSAEVKDISWHFKGDYLSSVAPTAGASAVLIHQVSKKKTQNPFSKSVGSVQAIAFHPSKPFFFHATQRHVRIYNLVKQLMVKKLSSGVKWISSIDVHPSGDHLLIGSYDRRVCWFDLDLSSTPFKTLKYHEKAIRSVAFHRKYPLMASASDDGTIHVFHSMVYSDLIKNPLIVPLKILRGHEVSGGLGVLSIAFHPTQPWIVSGGADGTIRLFQNIN